MSVFVKFNIQLFFDSSMSYTEAFSDLKNIVDELRFEATPRGWEWIYYHDSKNFRPQGGRFFGIKHIGK